MRRTLFVVGLAAIALTGFLGCSIPFTVDIPLEDPVEITLSTTLGTTQEKAVPVPEDARREGVEYDQVIINYTVTPDSAFSTTVELYISSDTEADTSRATADETIFNVELDGSGDIVSGSKVSEKLETILNGTQDSFVLGASVSSLDPGVQIDVALDATVSGSYSLLGSTQ